MQNFSFRILRVGLAVTFLWIGFLILKSPGSWGAFLQPWAENLLSVPVETVMLGTAFLDIAIGVLFLFDSLAWVAGLLGTAHMIVILIVSGINSVTVRDIGLMAATLAVFFASFPSEKFRITKKVENSNN